jgi:hypothetical protein
MSTIKYPAWQERFQAVVRETDPQKLMGLVLAAEGAIFTRILAIKKALMTMANGRPSQRLAIAC